MDLLYFRTAWRSLRANQTLSLIMVAGLSLTWMVSAWLWCYVDTETSFEEFHKNHDLIYRVIWSDSSSQSRTPYPLVKVLRSQPGVKGATSLTPLWVEGLNRRTVRFENPANGLASEEKNIIAVDHDFFRVFDFNLVDGNADSLTTQGPRLMISRTTARKYFGNQSATGKLLKLDAIETPFEVAGVFEDIGYGSHLRFDAVISYEWLRREFERESFFQWPDFGHYIYVELDQKANINDIEKNMTGALIAANDFAKSQEATIIQKQYGFKLQPLDEIHTTSTILWELHDTISLRYLYTIGGALFLILLAGTVNYLTYWIRITQVQIKNVILHRSIGASDPQLILNFLPEVFLLPSISFVLATIFLYAFNPLVYYIVELPPFYSSISAWLFLCRIVAICMLLLFSGSIAYFLYVMRYTRDGRSPNAVVTKTPGLYVSRMLLAIQIFSTTCLVCFSLGVWKQRKFMTSPAASLAREDIYLVTIRSPGMKPSESIAFTSAVRQLPGVTGITGVSNIPGGYLNRNPVFDGTRKMQLSVSELRIDSGFFRIFGLHVQPRSPNNDVIDPTNPVQTAWLNHQAEAQLERQHIAINNLYWDNDDRLIPLSVTGVVDDFFYNSIKEPLKSIMFIQSNAPPRFFFIKSNADFSTLRQAMVAIKSDVKFDFELTPMKVYIEDLYCKEAQFNNVLFCFAAFALIFTLLGVAGERLISFSFEEPDIRAVVVAVVLALPASLGMMLFWLNQYAVYAPLNPLVFVVVGVLELSLILLIYRVAGWRLANLYPKGDPIFVNGGNGTR
ncbi:MAG: ABC transporter permease [Bacteroidetes bacterium]|nr:ABC transporter permease [Bacteroidota bacterium]